MSLPSNMLIQNFYKSLLFQVAFATIYGWIGKVL